MINLGFCNPEINLILAHSSRRRDSQSPCLGLERPLVPCRIRAAAAASYILRGRKRGVLPSPSPSGSLPPTPPRLPDRNRRALTRFFSLGWRPGRLQDAGKWARVGVSGDGGDLRESREVLRALRKAGRGGQRESRGLRRGKARGEGPASVGLGRLGDVGRPWRNRAWQSGPETRGVLRRPPQVCSLLSKLDPFYRFLCLSPSPRFQRGSQSLTRAAKARGALLISHITARARLLFFSPVDPLPPSPLEAGPLCCLSPVRPHFPDSSSPVAPAVAATPEPLGLGLSEQVQGPRLVSKCLFSCASE